MNSYQNEGGFWRVWCIRRTHDAQTWIEAKMMLGQNLQQYPYDYHWVAFGWVNEDGGFEMDEDTFIEIDSNRF